MGINSKKQSDNKQLVGTALEEHEMNAGSQTTMNGLKGANIIGDTADKEDC